MKEARQLVQATDQHSFRHLSSSCMTTTIPYLLSSWALYSFWRSSGMHFLPTISGILNGEGEVSLPWEFLCEEADRPTSPALIPRYGVKLS